MGSLNLLTPSPLLGLLGAVQDTRPHLGEWGGGALCILGFWSWWEVTGACLTGVHLPASQPLLPVPWLRAPKASHSQQKKTLLR